jgi:hypothetical protein
MKAAHFAQLFHSGAVSNLRAHDQKIKDCVCNSQLTVMFNGVRRSAQKLLFSIDSLLSLGHEQSIAQSFGFPVSFLDCSNLLRFNIRVNNSNVDERSSRWRRDGKLAHLVKNLPRFTPFFCPFQFTLQHCRALLKVYFRIISSSTNFYSCEEKRLNKRLLFEL